MHNSNDVLDPDLIQDIDADLKRFSNEWQQDGTIGAPEPVEAFCDLLLRGGKRLRGVLAMQSYYAHGGHNKAVALGAARVFEIIQTSLLIVDDIADRSRLRRGGPSVHTQLETYAAQQNMKLSAAHYGEVQAMNVAYAGLHKATTELLNLPVDAEAARRACTSFHENILVTVNGQVDDIYNEATRGEVSERDIEGVLARKTPYYTILGPIELGAQLAGKTELAPSLKEYALQAGSAFQVADDIISTFGRENETGKGNNDDIREGKLTLLVHFALNHAAPEQLAVMHRILGNEEATAEECEMVRDIFKATGALDYAKDRQRDHERRALAALEGATETDPQFIAYLGRLADYLVNRNA